MSAQKGDFLLYAPNVHTGGGFVLLQSLLLSWPKDSCFVAWLDVRARDKLQLPANSKVEWVSPSFFSRMKSEYTLSNLATLNDRILCFHGLPPLLKNKGSIIIFQQNRNYLGLVALKTFAWRTRLRLRFEQTVAYLLKKRCKEYLVQTPSMVLALQKWYGKKSVSIRLLPFSDAFECIMQCEHTQYDFLYVADGEAHKNHRCLIDAWVLLAQQGFKPSLALTLSNRDESLLRWIQEQIKAHGLQIINLGHVPHNQLPSVYSRSKAMIFPSVSESFGLPLIEAKQARLPIVASELDFVRDVCEPQHTFDPNSPTSIARAVRRFIGNASLPITPLRPAEFLNAVMKPLD